DGANGQEVLHRPRRVKEADLRRWPEGIRGVSGAPPGQQTRWARGGETGKCVPCQTGCRDEEGDRARLDGPLPRGQLVRSRLVGFRPFDKLRANGDRPRQAQGERNRPSTSSGRTVYFSPQFARKIGRAS